MEEQIKISELLVKLEGPLPVCRVCLKVTLEYIDFEAILCLVGDREVTYLESYKELSCSSASVELDQRLPSRLCVSCTDDLSTAYLFKKRAESAENILQSLLTNVPAVLKVISETVPVGKIVPLETLVNVMKPEPSNSELNLNVGADSSDNETAVDDDKTIDPDTCLQCKDCGKICTTPESYRKHCLPHQLARRKTKARKSIKCKQCGKAFKLYSDLEKHLMVHAMAEVEVTKGRITYVCNTCRNSYHSVSAFIDHMHIHNGTKPYKCSICGSLRHTRAKLKSHKYHTHGKGLEIRLAIKKEKSELIQTEPLRFKTKCRYCGKLVVNEVIKRHEKKHENPEKRFKCSICAKMFYTEQNLKFHSEVHLEVRKPLQCTICGQKIMRRYSMKLHMQRHASEEEKFKCDICGTVLSAKSSLSEHREKHFQDSKYKCEHCDKTFIRKSRLVYHMRSHTGENPFKCEECGKSYKMQTRLKSHIKVAHTNHTYDCDKCESKFKSYGGLANHQFVHTGFPFKCPQCEKGAPNRERLKNHVLQVHKGFMSSERFDELYPKKTETRKIPVIRPKLDFCQVDEVVNSEA